MAAKVVGNHGPYIMNGMGGVGKTNTPDPSIGWVAVTGLSGDVAVLSASDIHGNIATSGIQSGYFFQSDGNSGAATIEFTLSNQALAKDPQAAALPIWDTTNTVTVAANPTIHGMPAAVQAFVALKVTFTSAGIIFIMAR